MSRKTPTNVTGGVYNSVAPVFTDGQFVAFQFDVNGNLLTTGGGSGSNASVNPVGTPVPGSATMIGLEDGSGNTQFVSSSNPLPITGSISATNPSVGSTGATAPTSATLLGVVVSGNLQPVSATYPVRVDPTDTTTQPVSFLSLPAGSNLIGQVEVSDGTNVLFTSGHPGYVQGTLTTSVGQTAQSTGTINSGSGTGSLVALSVVGYSTVIVTLAVALVSGGATVFFEVSDTSGGTNWYPVYGWSPSTPNQGFLATVAMVSATQPVSYEFDVSAWSQFRVRVSANTVITGSVGVGVIAQSNPGSTVAIATSGVLQVSPTALANTTTNPFSTLISDNTNPMGTMANFGTSPSTVKALNANVSLFQGTTLVSSGAPLQVTLANTGSNSTAVKVDPSAVTSPVSLASLPALAAGTNLIGQVSASAETSTVYNGTTALTPSFATISTSTSGASSLVSAVSSHKIRVLALSIVANAAVNVKFQSHVTPTDLTGLFYLAANGGFVLPFNPAGWFQTVSGEQLDINLSGSVAVGGCLTYVAV